MRQTVAPQRGAWIIETRKKEVYIHLASMDERVVRILTAGHARLISFINVFRETSYPDNTMADGLYICVYINFLTGMLLFILD